MSYTPNESLVNISRGRITGARPFSGYGKKATTGADSGVLWPNGPFVFPAASGVQLSLVSTSASDGVAGTGIRSVDLHYLDANLAEQSEVVVLNGTTPVLTVATNIRFVQCMHMVTFGTGKAAAGNISASNGGNVHSYIAIGEVRCTSSVRMVPAGKRLLINGIYGGSASNPKNAISTINAASSVFETHDYTTDSVFIPIASASFQDNSGGLAIECPIAFTEGQAFGMTFSCDAAAIVSGQWFGWLEDV